MTTPRALVLTGYGINCSRETQFAFTQAGAQADIVHINDLIDGRRRLEDYQILTFPGGFSFGDETGSGNGLANRIRNNIWEQVAEFVEKDHLVLGVCNGFQALVRLGILPAINKNYGTQQVSLLHNEGARYLDRWDDVECSQKSPWLKGIDQISLPIAHGEGQLYAPPEVVQQMQHRDLVAARYVPGTICTYQPLPPNPNGSLDDIAALTDESGRILGMMPHPERAIAVTHLPNWPLIQEVLRRGGIEIPQEGPGLQLFQNGVDYFK